MCLCRCMCCKECCGIWAGEWCLIKLLLVSVWGATQHPEGFGPLELSHREPLFIHTDLGKTQRGCFRINKQVPFKKIGIMINLPLVRAESPSMVFFNLKGQFKQKNENSGSIYSPLFLIWLKYTFGELLSMQLQWMEDIWKYPSILTVSLSFIVHIVLKDYISHLLKSYDKVLRFNFMWETEWNWSNYLHLED